MSFFFLLAFSPLLLLINAATYYVNEQSTATPQNGSLTNPFASIAQAYSSLGAIACDLVLLGSSASINASISLKSGANYTIRPDPSFTSTYFPINLNTGAAISTTKATLTLKNLQFFELNPSRSTSSPLFSPYSSSTLTFQSVLLRDIRTTDSYYYFCEGSSSSINIYDSEFRNLTDFNIFLMTGPIMVRGSRFIDLNQINIPFFYLALYTGPYNGYTFKNNSFENIVISNTTGGAFIYSTLGRINVTFEDFYINNVTFNGEDPFIEIVAAGSSYYDTQGKQTSIIVRNGVIQNMFEKHGPTLANVASVQAGLFVNSNGPTILKFSNLSVTNTIFTNLSLVCFTPATNQFAKSWKVLPYVELRDVTMKYTRNGNFLIFTADTVNISNIYLEGLTIQDVTVSYPWLRLNFGHALNVYNFTTNNITGPLFQITDILAHNFSTISFNNMYTSQKQSVSQQFILYFSKVNDLGKKGLNLSRPQNSYFDNIILNGYTSIDGIDFANNANNSFFMIGHTIYGKVYLTNSVWRNNLMNGYYTSSLPYFEVNNLTVDHDPGVPRAQIPIHKGFYLVGATKVVFKNLVVQNNQNYVFLDSYNIARRSSNDAITATFLTFENMTVLNNSAVYDDPNSPFSSLFIIYCPQKPITVIIHNSYFYNNTILTGLINALENYQAIIDFTNNTFDNNYATQAAAVFSSRNMRQQTSTLNITNNIFTNNRCDQNGGVFSFILTDYNMHPVNNTYQNNTAGLAGGVGHAFRASFVFLEENGSYSNNSAGSHAGAWFLSLNTYKSNLQSLQFSETSFTNSIAKQRGGSIYLENLGMTISECTFKFSQAGEAGGDFYISIGKSINITDTNFTASSAPQGSFLFAEEIDGTLTIDNIQITDIPSSNSMLATSSGSLNLADSVFENIDSPLFLLSDVTTSINNATFSTISCPKTSKSFCLLKATSSDSITISNSSLTNINSNVDLISLSECAQISLSNLTAQDMLKLTEENTDQIFVLNALNTKSLNITQSDFSRIGFSGVKAKTTNLNIQDSTFSNRLTTTSGRRLLRSQSINDAKLSQPIQFIILNSSNSTLTGVSFIENSLNTLVNGGGIQILGSGGVHTIMDCIFENNQASNGGALSIKGQTDSISIINSQFDNNQASGNGGALNFADQSVKTSFFITQSTFFKNTATLGGAIYLGNQALLLEASPFIENNALRGGAIATMSTSSNLVDLRQCGFTSNNASEGAALIALQEMNFAYSTSSFNQNAAQYGGDFASIPTSLRLKIYQFESYFLFINVTAKDLLSDAKTVLIYDSTTADASESIAFISGSQPNLLFEVTILDAFGNRMGQTNNAQGEFKISSSSSSSLVGLLGSTKFMYVDCKSILLLHLTLQAVAYIFKAFSVKGPFGATVTLSVQGTYVSTSSNTFQTLPSLKFPIILDKCAVGQIYDKPSAICSSCSSTTFSLEDPFQAQTCQSCLNHAVCLGGSIMYPAQGYWRIHESSENFVKCPQSKSCLGGSKDGGKNISLTGFCGEGYEGVACSGCSPGYARFGSSQTCVNCKESKLYYVMFGGYLLIQAIAIIFSVKMNLKGSKANGSFQKNSILQSTLIKIAIDFVQILTLVSELNFDFPSVVGYLYDGITKILPTNLDAVSVDCFIALKKGSNKHIFFNKVLVVLAEPFAYMIFAYLIWVLIFRRKKAPISKNPEFKFNMLLTIIVIIYVLQPGIIKIMFELFNCKNYGSSADPKYYLSYDVNVECWKPGHLAWGLCIAIPTLIVGLFIPFWILANWTRDKDLKAQQKAPKVYAFIFKSYQNNALFWEKTILIRKVLLILISVFITSQYLQAYLGFFLLALYYCFLIKISPYNSPQLNLAEAISVISSAFILYSGLYFVQVDNTDTISYMLFVCDVISGLVFVIFSTILFFKVFRETATKLTKKISRLGSQIGSKILTDKVRHSLKLNINSHNQQQTLAPPPLQAPTSLHFEMLSDPPTSTERIMSTERPFSPFINIHRSESVQNGSEDSPTSERRENSYTELPVFSPSNMTGAELLTFSLRPLRGLSIPINSVESPAEDQLSEILKDEMINSPPRSVENKTSKVLKFSQESWTEIVSKKKSKFFGQEN